MKYYLKNHTHGNLVHEVCFVYCFVTFLFLFFDLSLTIITKVVCFAIRCYEKLEGLLSSIDKIAGKYKSKLDVRRIGGGTGGIYNGYGGYSVRGGGSFNLSDSNGYGGVISYNYNNRCGGLQTKTGGELARRCSERDALFYNEAAADIFSNYARYLRDKFWWVRW